MWCDCRERYWRSWGITYCEKKTGRFINQFISYYQRKSLQDNSYHFITHFRILVNDIVKQAQLSWAKPKRSIVYLGLGFQCCYASLLFESEKVCILNSFPKLVWKKSAFINFVKILKFYRETMLIAMLLI